MPVQQHFNIGQIIYILSNQSQTVVPAVISEEDIRKVRTLEGVQEVVNYKLSVGPKGRQKNVNLNSVDGEIYISLENLRTTLTEKLTLFVDELVKNTENKVRDWYNINPSTDKNQIMDSPELTNENGQRFDPEQIIHAVETNTELNRTNSSQANPHPLQIINNSQKKQVGSLKETVREMVTDPDDELLNSGYSQNNPSSSNNLTNVILPDGKRVKLKL